MIIIFLCLKNLICRCKVRLRLFNLYRQIRIFQFRVLLGEPFTSLNDLSVHHVSYNEFEKQYGELSQLV